MIFIVFALVTSLIGHVLSPLAKKAKQFIEDKLFKKKEKEKAETIHGTIETKFPRVAGSGNPWVAPTMYNKAYKSNPINVEVGFEENRLQGLARLSVPGMESLPSDRSYSVQMGILEIGFMYGSEVILEEKEDFLGNTELKVRLLFSSPIKKIWFNDVSYQSSVLEIPLEFSLPCASVATQVIPPPVVVPTVSPSVNLPPRKKQNVEIPAIGYSF